MPPIQVIPYDPAWPDEFSREASNITRALGSFAITLQHIGSTSIPGIWAKPIIDLLGSVEQIEECDGHNATFASLGYEPMGEFGIAGRRYFRKITAAGVRTHHLHVFQVGSPQIARHLAFRDFLRAHPVHARAYAALKRKLAAQFPHDLDGYCDGKDAFIREMDAKAATWVERLGEGR